MDKERRIHIQEFLQMKEMNDIEKRAFKSYTDMIYMTRLEWEMLYKKYKRGII